MSPLEFVAQFPNHADFSRKSRVVLFAYYLRQYEAATQFSSPDIRQCFQQALLKEPDFQNGDYTIKWLEEWLERGTA